LRHPFAHQLISPCGTDKAKDIRPENSYCIWRVSITTSLSCDVLITRKLYEAVIESIYLLLREPVAFIIDLVRFHPRILKQFSDVYVRVFILYEFDISVYDPTIVDAQIICH
jgi:hypothetical protein